MVVKSWISTYAKMEIKYSTCIRIKWNNENVSPIWLFNGCINMNVCWDELDAKPHPLLTRYIINLFHNNEINIANGAAYIFTTWYSKP